MSGKIEELKRDISELRGLEVQATRHRVKDLLSLEIRKLSAELSILEQQQLEQGGVAAKVDQSSGSKRYQIKLNTYAWDQSPKYVKFYVTLKNVQTVPSENVVCKFMDKSLELNVLDLDNKDYQFVINGLLNEINPAESNWKVKSDMVMINVAKVKNADWSHVTALEKKVHDQKSEKFKPDSSEDPSDGIMSMMKKMYAEGDDEMKRTIAKAWSESQNKTSGFP